jgi:hypothetical protein
LRGAPVLVVWVSDFDRRCVCDIMTKQHLIWLLAFFACGLLALAFIYANWLPRVPFVFT